MPKNKRITKKVLFTKSVEILQPILNLADWKLVVKFSSSKTMKPTADCEAYPEYKVAIIRMNINELGQLSHNEIVSVAIHEMIHCVMWELGAWAQKITKDVHKTQITKKYEETAVTAMEKIILPLVANKLNHELRKCGYSSLDLRFTDFIIGSE